MNFNLNFAIIDSSLFKKLLKLMGYLMLLRYTPGVAELPVSARPSSLYLSTNHALHDSVDGAVSGGARLAALSPANEHKTFPITSFF